MSDSTVPDILALLRTQACPANVEGQRRFGITPTTEQLGINMAFLRSLAKGYRHHHALALQLWKQPVYEARLLAALIDDPSQVTRDQMNAWAADFDAWTTCDNACMHLFRKTAFAYDCAHAWVRRDETFVKRAGFVLVATLAVHAKKDPDSQLLAFIPELERAATDARNFVKKAVNWTLRQLGKRNGACKLEAIACAQRILKLNTPSARWIARDALRELED